MRYKLFTLVAAAALFFAAGTLAAQEPETQASQNPAVDLDVEGTMSLEGKIVNASPEEIILQTEDGREVFLLESEDLYAEPILEGADAKVWFVERADRYYATRLEVAGGDLESGARLPQTSGILPFLTLVGLAALALAGATTLRRRLQS